MGELNHVVLHLIAHPAPSSNVTVPDAWWAQDGELDRALQALVDHDLWPSSLSVARRKQTRETWTFADAKTWRELARAWPAGYYRLDPSDESGTHLELHLDRGNFRVWIVYRGDELERRRATLPTAAARGGLAFATAVRPTWSVEPSWMTAEDFEVPRRRPPVDPLTLAGRTLVDVIDVGRVRADVAGGWQSQWVLDELERAATVALPASAERYVNGEIFAIRWVESLVDPQAVRDAQMAQEDWVRAHLTTKPDADFNELGDRRINAALAPAPPLTLYDPSSGFACLAVGAWSDGSVDPADEQHLAALRAKPPVPITRLAAVVTSRDVAIAAFERLKRAGADTVLYMADDGRVLWDPFPPGLWRDT
jgi:hypothetical protein